MAQATSQSELERLLAWQLPRCKKFNNDAGTGTTTISQGLPLSAATAPSPTVSTNFIHSLAGNSFSHSESIFAPPAVEQSSDTVDVRELSEFHLADDLVLRNVIQLPGLAKYLGMMCDAALKDNTRLPVLESSHLCGSRGRRLLAERHFPVTSRVVDRRDVQEFCAAREIVAAATASALLNSSASAWNQCEYLIWQHNANSGNREESVQSYLSFDRQALPSDLDLSQRLLAADDYGLTPFVLYYYTEPDFLKGIAKAFEHLGSTLEEFPWTHCSPKDNSCKTPSCKEYVETHGKFPRSGRTAGPDSTIVKDIVSQIKSDVAKFDGRKPKSSQLLLARQLWRKVWTKLVAINGTFAIIGDGQHEMICMRHRHLQTLFTSPCHDVSRDPYDRTLPSQMRVRIGLNIIATLDLAWRGELWRRAAQIGVQVPTKALSRHLTTFLMADDLARQLLEATKVWALWVKAPPVLLRYVARRIQPSEPNAGGVLHLGERGRTVIGELANSKWRTGEQSVT